MVVSVVVASGLVFALGLDAVRTVADVTQIPSALPAPALPDSGCCWRCSPRRRPSR